MLVAVGCPLYASGGRSGYGVPQAVFPSGKVAFRNGTMVQQTMPYARRTLTF
jgi:hypothetical protein